MKKYILSLLFVFLMSNSTLFSQNVSYIQPDIGAPGMGVYIEIIGPFDDLDNFGPDGFYMNNLGDNVYLSTARTEDADKIVFGPLSVSWDGRMISTHIFIKEDANFEPNSWEWDKLNPEFKIAINVIVNGNSTPVGQQPVFYIVQPCPGGDKSGNPSRRFGDISNLGKRSPRGAILFDSLTLANDTYTVSTNDCDPNTDGNQGYLPFILMAKHYIRGGGNTRINVDGDYARSGHGGNGGPGGGGGGGKYDNKFSMGSGGDNGGSGYAAGGHGGINVWPISSGSHKNTGTGSSRDGYGLSGVLPSLTEGNYEASGGGTGHPFGESGRFAFSGTSYDQKAGGHGGGTGYRNNEAGGAGGYGTRGSNGSSDSGDDTGGFAHGNIMVVPIAGGSGSASKNPHNMDNGASGGGGGGAVAVFAPELNGLILSAVGGLSSSNRTGGGSGGFAGMFAKLTVDKIDFYLHGGNNNTSRSGGAGRARCDIPSYGSKSVQPLSETPEYRGPTIDTSHFVFRQHTLFGSHGTGETVDVYLKSENGNWELLDQIFYPANNQWMTELDLDINDSLFYVVAVQRNDNPITDEYLLEPNRVQSFAAANILTVMTTPDIDGVEYLQLTVKDCENAEGFASTMIHNLGDADLELTLDNANMVFGDRGYEYVSPLGQETVEPGDSLELTFKYTYKAGQTRLDTFLIPHNDLIEDPRPWAIVLDFKVDPITVEMWEEDFARELGTDLNNSLDLGEVCAGEEIRGYFEVWNRSNFNINLNNMAVSAGETRFTASLVGKSSLPPSDSGLVEIIFTDIPESGMDQLSTTVTFGIDECPDNFYSTEVTVGINRAVLTLSGTADFGEVRVGSPAETDFTLTNEGNIAAYITAADLSFTLGTETYFQVIKSVPPLPYLLEPAESMIITVEFTPDNDTEYSTTFTVESQESDNYCAGIAEIELLGKGIRSQIVMHPYDFGTNSKCFNWIEGKITAQNQGSATVQIVANPVISGTDAVAFRVVAPPALPVNIDPGESVEYIVEFNSSEPPVGTKTATFTLTTDDPEAPIIWTALTGTSEDMQFTADPLVIDFGAVPITQKPTKQLIITNNAVTDAVLKSVSAESSKVSASPTSGVIRGNGQLLTLDIEALFDEDGPIDGELTIYFSAPCPDSLTIQVIGTGISGNLSYNPTLDFGLLAFCQDSILTVELNNIGDVAITIDTMEIRGADAALFDFVSSMVFDLTIEANGEPLSREIIFSPSGTNDGIKTAELVVTVTENGETKEKVIILTGEVTTGLIATPPIITLSTFINETANAELSLHNQDQVMIEIMALEPLAHHSDKFTITEKGGALPIDLNQDEFKYFDVVFTPGAEIGVFVDTLKIQIGVAGCAAYKYIELIGTSSPMFFLSVWMPDTLVTPDLDDFRFPIYASIEADGVPDTTFDFTATIVFNESIFLPRELSKGTIVSSDRVFMGDRTLKISVPNIKVTNGETVLTEIIGWSMLGSVESSSIEFTETAVSPSGIISIENVQGGNIKIEICKEGKDPNPENNKRLLIHGSVLDIVINPNPAGNIIHAEVSVLEVGTHSIEIVNTRGERKIINQWTVSLDGEHKFEFDFDMQDEASGMYYVVIRSATRTKAMPVFIVK